MVQSWLFWCFSVSILTTDWGWSPVDRDALLAAFVRVRSDGRAKTLTISPAVAVASVGQAVPIKPGHINLKGTHNMHPQSQIEKYKRNHRLEQAKLAGRGRVYRESSIQLFTREELMRHQDKGMWVNWCTNNRWAPRWTGKTLHQVGASTGEIYSTFILLTCT